MDKQLLKSYIVKNDSTQAQLAQAMGISLSRLNAKINETNAQFNQNEIAFLIKRYKLTDEEVREIFFAKKLS